MIRKIFICLATLLAAPLLLSGEQAPEHELMLYYSSTCPYSQDVLTYLKKADRHIPMCDVKKDLKGKQRLKSYGEPATVPCLIIDKKPLYNSGAIIQWLTENKS